MSEKPSGPALRDWQQVLLENAVAKVRENGIVLLTGAPGTGKSYLARLVAERLADESPKMRAIEDKEKRIRRYSWPSMGPSRMKDLADGAKAGTIILLDDLDGIPPRALDEQQTIATIRNIVLGGGWIIATARRIPEWLAGAQGLNIHVLELSESLPSTTTNEGREPIDIYVDPGGASLEALTELFDALSDLHVAAGGLGLQYKTDGNSIFTLEEVVQ